MTALLKSRVSLVWLGLIIATLISWRIGTDHGVHAHLATTIVLLVAFVKVRFVGLYFMELRDAPLPLRGIFEGYCLVVCTTLIVLYLA
ncbi:MAG TPA: cytochrome C oxidase subunit IV family protein [Solirubrobacteraceae bacterium]|jgi:heme/copper-type cytochrome/quinol oxidase subunit 4|nr:cytochrome C oxidase subunit IV family protein [Solirubrobacteraceae bacterium]